jgi:hypothetical protein
MTGYGAYIIKLHINYNVSLIVVPNENVSEYRFGAGAVLFTRNNQHNNELNDTEFL